MYKEVCFAHLMLGGCGVMKFLAFTSSEKDFDAIWANLGGKNHDRFYLFFYDKRLHLPSCYVWSLR